MMTLFATLATALIAAPDTYVLKTDRNVWDIAVEDLNGDGRSDVIALICDETTNPPEKALSVYLCAEDGSYPDAPTTTFELPTQLGTLFLAEVDGQAPREIVGAHMTGAETYSYRDGAWTRTASTKLASLFPSKSSEPKFLKNVAIDLNGDGIDEWLVPVADGFEIRNPGGVVTTVACDVVSEIRRGDSIYISHRLPDVKAFSLPGQSDKALAFLSDEVADFAYGDGWREHFRYDIPVNVEEKWEASAQMKDLNGDDWPDLLVTQTRGTVNLEVLTQIYVASEPFKYPETPTYSFSAKGAISSPGVDDVDGDSDQDLVFIRIPFGVNNLINFFVRGKISIEADVYLYDNGYRDRPDFDTSLTLDAPEGREQIAYTMGDFNGDGRLDAGFGTKADELVVHIGEPERFLSKQPWVKLTLPSFGIAQAVELNGNPGKDIVIFHPGGKNAQRIEVIRF